jgi:hypothetical protein
MYFVGIQQGNNAYSIKAFIPHLIYKQGWLKQPIVEVNAYSPSIPPMNMQNGTMILYMQCKSSLIFCHNFQCERNLIYLIIGLSLSRFLFCHVYI